LASEFCKTATGALKPFQRSKNPAAALIQARSACRSSLLLRGCVGGSFDAATQLILTICIIGAAIPAKPATRRIARSESATKRDAKPMALEQFSSKSPLSMCSWPQSLNPLKKCKLGRARLNQWVLAATNCVVGVDVSRLIDLYCIKTALHLLKRRLTFKSPKMVPKH
jgi:hypothetical protein